MKIYLACLAFEFSIFAAVFGLDWYLWIKRKLS